MALRVGDHKAGGGGNTLDLVKLIGRRQHNQTPYPGGRHKD